MKKKSILSANDQTQSSRRMRPDYQRLSFLTVNQALDCLHHMTGISMTLEDLISQCEDGHCVAYIGDGALKGFTQTIDLDEQEEEVFGAGSQRVINIHRLQGLGAEATATLSLAGPVFTGAWDNFDEVTRVWNAEVPQAVNSLRFKPSDISALVDSFADQPSVPQSFETRERESVGKLIAMLVEMNGLDGLGHYKVAKILLSEAARLGLSPLSVNTIVTYLRPERLPE